VVLSDVGTWKWAQRTGGRLSRRDRLELIRQGALARLSRLPARQRRELPELTVPDPPDSALARAAEECARELSSAPLHAHCVRTWLFAALFGARVKHDPELLYLACLLHDLGLTEAHDRRDPTAACFAVEGARAAHQLLLSRGQPEERAVAVANAISLHMNISVPERLGVEAHLLGKGVTLDVVGRGLDRLPKLAVDEVNISWPRAQFVETLGSAVATQARARPQSRAALLQRLGFAKLMAANPLERHEIVTARPPG
jgi:hypothetical protein